MQNLWNNLKSYASERDTSKTTPNLWWKIASVILLILHTQNLMIRVISTLLSIWIPYPWRQQKKILAHIVRRLFHPFISLPLSFSISSSKSHKNAWKLSHLNHPQTSRSLSRRRLLCLTFKSCIRLPTIFLSMGRKTIDALQKYYSSTKNKKPIYIYIY